MCTYNFCFLLLLHYGTMYRTSQHFLIFVSILILATPVAATAAKEPTAIMCLPGERIFSETFDPDTTSHRWAFKGDFSLRDGNLRRTELYPTENRRVRIQDASFYRLFSLISGFQIEQRTSAWLLGVGVITTALPKSAQTIFKSTHQVIVTLALFPRTSVNV